MFKMDKSNTANDKDLLLLKYFFFSYLLAVKFRKSYFRDSAFLKNHKNKKYVLLKHTRQND